MTASLTAPSENDYNPERRAPTARDARLEQAARNRMEGLRCVLEALEDRGNRAAVLRSAESFGILHVHEIPAKAVRGRGIANGGEKWLHVHQHTSPQDCIDTLHALNFLVFAAVAAPTAVSAPGKLWDNADLGSTERCLQKETTVKPLEQIDFSQRVALVFGNERLGVSSELMELCDGTFTIAMRGLSESLNVSVAVAVALHSGRVAREAALASGRVEGRLRTNGEGDLNDEELEALIEEYRQRSQDHAFQRRQRQEASALPVIGATTEPDT